MKRIIVVGGGPSGIVSAIHAKTNENEVIVLERNNRPLKKLLMTGNGKCNYFNEEYSVSNYHSENLELVSNLITEENLKDVSTFFDSMGLIPRIKNGYYYPLSNQAVTMEKLLLGEAKKKGIEIHCESLVEKIQKENDHFIVTCNGKEIICDKVILSTGSKAVPRTGSDGMGYSFLEEMGHSIIPPVPALVPLETEKMPYLKEWDGVRSDVSLELIEEGECVAQEEGEIQLTSYGISGICTFNLSQIATRGLSLGKREEVVINFVPFIKEYLGVFFDDYTKKLSHKNLLEICEGFLNTKLASVLIKEAGLKETCFYRDLTNEEKNQFFQVLRYFKVTVTGSKDFDACQVCNGGVPLTEVDTTTLESKLVPGLYIIGELLDMNGNCGGYNLTTCWITGILAGRSVAND